MRKICEKIQSIRENIKDAELIVVSKYRSLEELQAVYDCGIRKMAENRVQEMLDKKEKLPEDIQWHLIGHLQKNKVKYLAPFVALIHSVDSLELLEVIDKEARKNHRTIPFLFQLHIAQEESKYGIDLNDFEELWDHYKNLNLQNVRCEGLMGMATFSDDVVLVRNEFKNLKDIYDQYAIKCNWKYLSMGMSGDYPIALECGSNMLRIGSKIFE
jgi:pyridoxal phosphate enzyme (YggS family)